MSIRENATIILQALAEYGQSENDECRGRYNFPGSSVKDLLGEKHGKDLTPDEINDAVERLERKGYLRVHKPPGTAPFNFGGIELTSQGRLAHEDAIERIRASQQAAGASDSVRDLPVGKRIFIDHGRALDWLVLSRYIEKDLNLECVEFNSEAPEGLATKERLDKMLKEAGIAFIVMTPELDLATGKKLPRPNVIHEAGLFQGRLGFQRAIVLLEDGCEQFSNIEGITQIRFPKDNIQSAFPSVRRVLSREGFLAS